MSNGGSGTGKVDYQIITKELEARIEKVRDITKIQCYPGNWDKNEYMRGLANGLLIAVAILEVKEPTLKEHKPKEENEMGEIDFKIELKSLLNCYSKENDSNTPDFVLAHYLCLCLEAYNSTIALREPRDVNGEFIRNDELISDLITSLEEAIRILNSVQKSIYAFDRSLVITNMEAIVLDAKLFLGSKEKIKPPTTNGAKK